MCWPSHFSSQFCLAQLLRRSVRENSSSAPSSQPSNRHTEQRNGQRNSPQHNRYCNYRLVSTTHLYTNSLGFHGAFSFSNNSGIPSLHALQLDEGDIHAVSVEPRGIRPAVVVSGERGKGRNVTGTLRLVRVLKECYDTRLRRASCQRETLLASFHIPVCKVCVGALGHGCIAV